MSLAELFFAGYSLALTIFFIGLPVAMRNAVAEDDGKEDEP